MSHTKRVLEKIQNREALDQNEKVFSSLSNSYFTIIQCTKCRGFGYTFSGQKRHKDICNTCKGFKYLYVPSDDAYEALTNPKIEIDDKSGEDT